MVVVLAVLLIASIAALAVLVVDKADTAIATTRLTATHELGQLYDAARDQSATFSSTSFIGYSVGRYYGFASAFSQISPNPERASALLRQAFGPEEQGAETRDAGEPAAGSLAPALAPYMAVYDRFNGSFTDMIASSVFDDLYLIDRFGHVVYTLRKAADLGRDLNDASGRQTPLGVLYHDVSALVAKVADPARVYIITPPQRLDGGATGMLVGRPVVRYGTLEGMVAFRLPLAVAEKRLAALQRPGILLRLTDAAGVPIASSPGVPVISGAAGSGPIIGPGRVYGVYPVADSDWRVQVVGNGAGLTGGWTTVTVALALLAVGVLGWLWWDWGMARTAATPPVRVAAPADLTPKQERPPPPGPPPADPPMPLAPAAVSPVLPAVSSPGSSGPVPVATPGVDLDASEEFRQCIVDVMTLTLDFWHHSKRKGKIELAEESGLWRVYMDRSSLQTRTLDKYLLVETLPRNPRWRDVVRTAEFVLRHCPDAGPLRDGAREALTRLKQHLRQAERI